MSVYYLSCSLVWISIVRTLLDSQVLRWDESVSYFIKSNVILLIRREESDFFHSLGKKEQ